MKIMMMTMMKMNMRTRATKMKKMNMTRMTVAIVAEGEAAGVAAATGIHLVVEEVVQDGDLPVWILIGTGEYQEWAGKQGGEMMKITAGEVVTTPTVAVEIHRRETEGTLHVVRTILRAEADHQMVAGAIAQAEVGPGEEVSDPCRVRK